MPSESNGGIARLREWLAYRIAPWIYVPHREEREEAFRDLAEIAYGSRDAIWSSPGVLVEVALLEVVGELREQIEELQREAEEIEDRRLDEWLRAQRAEEQLGTLRTVAAALHERVEMDESIGICLSSRVESMNLGTALSNPEPEVDLREEASLDAEEVGWRHAEPTPLQRERVTGERRF